MTNAIGTGARNIAINLPIDGRQVVGRVANRLDVSIGELFRDSIITHLEKVSPPDAAELKRIWRDYYRSVGSAILAFLFCGILAWSWTHGDEQDMRRASRNRRGRSEDRIEEFHIEEEA